MPNICTIINGVRTGRLELIKENMEVQNTKCSYLDEYPIPKMEVAIPTITILFMRMDCLEKRWAIMPNVNLPMIFNIP